MKMPLRGHPFRRKYLGRQIVAFVLFCVITIALQQGWIRLPDSEGVLSNEPGSYSITRFVDGDTIVVNMNGTEETVRFIGIDTPETHKPNTPVQCYGPAAAAYTKNRIGDQRVRLVSDSKTTNRDRYNRLLRYVVLPDGTTLNLELVQKGYAFAYAFPFSRSDEFFTAMDKAKADNAGLWGNCAPYQGTNGQWHTEELSGS